MILVMSAATLLLVYGTGHGSEPLNDLHVRSKLLGMACVSTLSGLDRAVAWLYTICFRVLRGYVELCVVCLQVLLSSLMLAGS
jgi:hypothetical protein